MGELEVTLGPTLATPVAKPCISEVSKGKVAVSRFIQSTGEHFSEHDPPSVISGDLGVGTRGAETVGVQTPATATNTISVEGARDLAAFLRKNRCVKRCTPSGET